MASKAQIIDINKKSVSCDSCIVNHKCIVHANRGAGDCVFQDGGGQHQLLHRGDYLYRAGESLQALFMIRSGVVKTYFVSEDGEEQILGFHVPGEIVGFDGIARGEFASNATALDTCSVCRLPLETFSRADAKGFSLQQALLKGMSREILRHEAMLMLLGKKKADQRLASFLCSHSTYQSSNGFSATVFTLAMTRTDIGKYLGLTVETISRVLSRLQAQDIIAVHTNRIQILDLPSLQELSGDAPADRPHGARPAVAAPGRRCG